MSLKDDLRDRGVKLADLAKELEEAYGNLYTALSMEAAGGEIRHKAVLARLEKVRTWLASERTAEARVAASVEGQRNSEDLRRRVAGWGVPSYWSVELDAEDLDLHCGDVIVVREADQTARYRFLRRVTNHRNGASWIDVYGGTGLKDAAEHRFRSFTPERLGLRLVEVRS